MTNDDPRVFAEFQRILDAMIVKHPPVHFPHEDNCITAASARVRELAWKLAEARIKISDLTSQPVEEHTDSADCVKQVYEDIKAQQSQMTRAERRELNRRNWQLAKMIAEGVLEP